MFVMRGRLGLVVILAAGCGRLGFDDQTPASPPDATAAIDAPALPDAAALLPCSVTYPGALLCEGFEAADVMWDYTVIDQGTATRTTTRAASGVAALEVTTTDAAAFKYARWGRNGVFPALTSGDVYVREWLWLDGSTVVTDQLSVLVFGQGVTPFPSANLLLTPGAMTLKVDGAGTPTALEFPRDRWVCVTVHLVIDAVAGSAELSLDGTMVAAVTGIDTDVAGGYTNLDAGVHYATTDQGAATLWIDEIVADTQPIACD